MTQPNAAQVPPAPTTPCVRPPSNASHNGNGYYRMSINGKLVYTHRHAYELAKGPIPEGLTLDHLCRQTWCCNPDHLEPVTAAENVMRSLAPPAVNARKDSCPKCGGPYTTYGDGNKRRCDSCRFAQRVASGETSGTGRLADHNRRKTHCPAGHPYDEANTYYTHTPGKPVMRLCRACARERARARRKARKS